MRWLLVLALVAGLLGVRPSPVMAACHPIPVTWYSPTGIAGCTIYGAGLASWWPGPGVARNDCLWPWTDCPPIVIHSSQTGRSLTVTPTMFCDCYTGTSSRQRLVDLDPAALQALGLDPAAGLYSVTVRPLKSAGNPLPDTAMSRSR